jgi:hypothetical protein
MQKLITIFLFLFVFIISFNRSNAITFNVTSPEDDEFAFAWDDINTEEDESSDGMCQDSLGRCTLRAALQELSNIGGGTIIISVNRIIVDQELFGMIGGSDIEIISSGNNRPVIEMAMSTALEMGDNCKITGITFELTEFATGISFGANCSAENLLFKGNGAASAIICGDNCQIFNCRAESTGSGFILVLAVEGNGSYISQFDFKALSGSSNGVIGIDGSENVVDNINISGYSLTGIAINGEESKNNIIKNSNIGGDTYSPSSFGIMINGRENKVQNCEILNSGLAGIAIGGFGELNAVKNIISDNYIGCKKNFSPAGNGDGIQIMSNDNLIENNYIGFNQRNGININSVDEAEFGTVSINIISGNNIGGKKDSDLKIPNEQNGIQILGSAKENIIGSDNSKDYEPNHIANNKRYGIYCQKISGNIPEKNAFRKNIITNNADIGIKIDESAQQNVKPPMFDSLVNGIIYGHGGIPGSRIDIYENDLDISGSGEAKKWIKEFSVGEPNYQLQIGGIPENGISATVTNQTNSTSEFSCNIPSIMSFNKQLDYTFFDKITDNANNEHTMTFYPDRNITEAKYKINEKPWSAAQISGNTAKFTVNMGSDFKAGKNEILFSSTSCNGFVDTMLIYTYVVTVSEFAASAGDYSTSRNDPELKYIKGSKIEWPNPNLNTSYSIPSIVPYIGGTWGLKETGLKFQMTVSSLGSEIPQTVEVNGGFGLGEKQYDLNGEGNVKNSLLRSGLKTDGTISGNLPLKLWEKEENLFTVIPTTQTICELPLGSELCAFLNGLLHAGVRASLTLDLGGSADFGAGGNLEWKSGELISSLTLSVIGSANLAGIAGFTVEGSGTGTLKIPFPSLSPTASGSLNFSAYGQIAGIGSISGSKSWSIGGGIIDKNSDNPVVLNNLLPKDNEIKVISSNSPFDANASSYLVDDNKLLVVWAESSTNIDSPARDIMLSLMDNGNNSKTINLTKDGKNNHNPKIITNKNDKVIIVWESNELPNKKINEIDLVKYVKQSKIGYSILKISDLSQISSGFVDVPDSFDFAPELVLNGNKINLIWTKSDGSTIVGNNLSKLSIMQSNLEENIFTNPVELFSEEYIISKSVASSSTENLLICYEKDFDGELNTINDREIMLYDQTLSGNKIKRITNNSTPDLMPVMSISGDNKFNIAFTNLESILYIENGEPAIITEIYKGEIGLNFANAYLLNDDKNQHLIWNSTRGFNELSKDNKGKWSNLFRTSEFDYVNILNTAHLLSNGTITAVFQKFDNRNNSVLLEKNELGTKTLKFSDINTNISNENYTAADLEIFPNPSNDRIFIKNSEKNIIIYNSLGEILYKYENYSENSLIFIDKLLPGVYYIRSGNKTAKFIKI